MILIMDQKAGADDSYHRSESETSLLLTYVRLHYAGISWYLPDLSVFRYRTSSPWWNPRDVLLVLSLWKRTTPALRETESKKSRARLGPREWRGQPAVAV